MARSSYRGRYSQKKIPRVDLKMIMAAGLNAPSGCNKQTVSLIGIDQEDLVAQIKAVIDPPIAQSAPAFICVLSEKIFAYRNKCFAIQDYSAAIENMLLAIVALGYQSCWYEGHICDDDRINDRIARILDVPDSYELVCILPVGEAVEQVRVTPKKSFESRACFNGFELTQYKASE